MEQQARAGHGAFTVWLETTPEVAYRVERLLFDANRRVHSLLASENTTHIAELCQALNDAGVIALVCGSSDAEWQERTREAVGMDSYLRVEAETAEEKTEDAARRIYRIIEEQGFGSRFAPSD
jgi:cobalamin biosynthesis Mg chelatase CobN